jgi:hypothetical protein
VEPDNNSVSGHKTIFYFRYCVPGNYPLSCFYFETHNVSETGFCLRLLVEPTQLGPIERASPWAENPVSETLCVLNKNRTMDNVQKQNYCVNIPSSQTCRFYLYFTCCFIWLRNLVYFPKEVTHSERLRTGR